MTLKYVEVKKLNSFKLDKPFFIVGLPGAGLVGSISTTYLTNEKDFVLAGYFESEKLAPVAAVHDYSPLPPVRIMVSEQKNAVVFLSEASIPLSITLPLTNFIFDIAKKLNSRLIISIGGMAKPSPKNRKTFLISSSLNAYKKVEKFNIGERIKEGATTGISALLLTKCRYSNIDMITLLVETGLEVGDPKASSIALKNIGKIMDKKINISKLEKEAREYEKSMEVTEIQTDDGMYR